MAKMKIFTIIVNKTEDYETSTSVSSYKFKENAINVLKGWVEQDYMPKAIENDWFVDKNNEMCFSAGIEGDFSEESIKAEIIENEVNDYSIGE